MCLVWILSTVVLTVHLYYPPNGICVRLYARHSGECLSHIGQLRSIQVHLVFQSLFQFLDVNFLTQPPIMSSLSYNLTILLMQSVTLFRI